MIKLLAAGDVAHVYEDSVAVIEETNTLQVPMAVIPFEEEPSMIFPPPEFCKAILPVPAGVIAIPPPLVGDFIER